MFQSETRARFLAKTDFFFKLEIRIAIELERDTSRISLNFMFINTYNFPQKINFLRKNFKVLYRGHALIKARILESNSNILDQSDLSPYGLEIFSTSISSDEVFEIFSKRIFFLMRNSNLNSVSTKNQHEILMKFWKCLLKGSVV